MNTMKLMLKVGLLLWMLVVIAASFLYAPMAQRLFEMTRVIYFHLPVAWITVVAFAFSAGWSLVYLRNRNLVADAKAAIWAELGLVACILATVTGSIFAKGMWGSYWNWDPRESSFLLLLFLYGAYLFLRTAIEDPVRRGRIAAAYALFAAILMPFLVFVAPRVTQSLHPQTVINTQGKILMDTPTRTVFFAALATFTGLFVWLLSLDARSARLSRRGAPPAGQNRPV